MGRYVIRRLLQAIPTVLVSSVLLFGMLNLMRGDAIDIYFGTSESRNPQAEAALRAQLGLDRPLPAQYLLWLGRLAGGDFGQSWNYKQPVLAMVGPRLVLSFEIAGIAIAISVVCSLALGIFLAAHRDSFLDQALRVASLVAISAPLYWVALGLVLLLASTVHWTPPPYVGFAEDPAQHLAAIGIPAVLWGLLSVPSFSRFVRNAMLDVLGADYVRTARAKGLGERRLMFGHALRNAAGPLATVVGLSIGHAAGGTLLLEVIFSLPGMGRLWLTSITQRDHPLILGIGVLISVLFILVNLLTDLSYAWFDPRIRYE
jgi:peptide/nickel transport system permease protein